MEKSSTDQEKRMERPLMVNNLGERRLGVGGWGSRKSNLKKIIHNTFRMKKSENDTSNILHEA